MFTAKRAVMLKTYLPPQVKQGWQTGAGWPSKSKSKRKDAKIYLMSQTIDGQNVNRNGILIRGLIILLCAGIINATSVFITPLAEFYGWEASAIANVGTTMLTFWPIGSLLGGKLLQKFGGKAVTLIGAVTFGAGLVLTGLVPNSTPGMLYFTYSFLIGMGNGITYCGAMYCVMGWYPDKKGLATGLCMAFNGGSSAFLAPLCSGITQMFNVKVTLFSCGIVCAVICIVCGLGMKSAPVGYVPVGYVQPSSGAALSSQYESYPISRAWRTRQFWLQLGAQAFFPAFYLIMFSRFSMFMTDKGIDLAYATLGVSLYNVGNVVGRLLLGKLTDNIGYKKVYLCCWALCMICGICLLTGSSVAMILIAYICLGAGFGATNSVYPVMTNTSFGPVYAGNIYGFALLGYMVMTQVIPIVTNATITSTGGYTTAFILAFVLCTLGAVCGVLIPKLDRPRLKEATESEKE